jgi:hypothetical protein
MMKRALIFVVQWIVMPVVVVLYWIPFILTELMASVAWWLDDFTRWLGDDGIFRYKRFEEDEWRVLAEDHPAADTINGAAQDAPSQGIGGRNGPGSADGRGQ